MTKLYQIDVPVAATLYVKATTAEEAAEIARGWHMESIEVEGEGIDGSSFEWCLKDREFTAALSPAMTVGSRVELEVDKIIAAEMEEVDE